MAYDYDSERKEYIRVVKVLVDDPKDVAKEDEGKEKEIEDGV